MSLTSYRTAPPRVKSEPNWPAGTVHIVLCDGNLKGLASRIADSFGGQEVVGLGPVVRSHEPRRQAGNTSPRPATILRSKPGGVALGGRASSPALSTDAA